MATMRLLMAFVFLTGTTACDSAQSSLPTAPTALSTSLEIVSFEIGPAFANETQIRLVDKRRRLQRMSGAFVAHVPTGQAVQLAMDKGHQSIQSGLIAVAPGHQQFGEATHRRPGRTADPR